MTFCILKKCLVIYPHIELQKLAEHYICGVTLDVTLKTSINEVQLTVRLSTYLDP